MANAKKRSASGEMTVREAGRKGGETTAERHGHEFYEEIGRKGGQKVRDEYGIPFYEEIGHKGGQKVRDLIAEGKRALGSGRRSS
ncbi:MAG TPA: KGG domain-containing protein [Armatimonadota bacterium]|nr:KGG domain-containing protein [Armatimonadota bacterium]